MAQHDLVLIVFVGSLAFLVFRSGWKESDLDPILWKWFVRLIWLGSIVFFQALELQRYLEGFRPFFGLYAGLLFAAVVWFPQDCTPASAAADASTSATGQDAKGSTQANPIG